MALPVPLALVVEAIERPAAGDLEADVPQVESNARGEPLLIIENLVVPVVAVGTVVLVMVPVEARVGPQRLEDLPGRARAHRPDRKILRLEGEGLERLELDRRKRHADDGAEAVGGPPHVRDAGYRQGLFEVEDCLIARV